MNRHPHVKMDGPSPSYRVRDSERFVGMASSNSSRFKGISGGGGMGAMSIVQDRGHETMETL